MRYSKTARKWDFNAWSDHAETVTSLLETNVVDEMWRWQVYDIDDRATLSITDWIQWKNTNIKRKVGNILIRSPKSLIGHNQEVTNITVIACGVWNLTKKYEKSENDWGDMNSRDFNLTISGTKNNPRWNIINDPNYKINGSICVRRLYPRKVVIQRV